MLKTGREAIVITLITAIFSSIAIIINSTKQWFALGIFAACIIVTYILVIKSIRIGRNEVKDPSSHPVFYTIEHFLTSEINNIPVTNARKKCLITLYLETKIKKIRQILLEYIENRDVCCIPSKLMYLDMNVRNEINSFVPDIFFNKVVEWDKRYNSWPIDTINHILDSVYYADNDVKVIAIFDCIQVIIKSTIVAVENTINEINGEIDKELENIKNV